MRSAHWRWACRGILVTRAIQQMESTPTPAEMTAGPAGRPCAIDDCWARIGLCVETLEREFHRQLD